MFGVKEAWDGDEQSYIREAEYGLSEQMVRYWINFADTGSPNAPVPPAVRWPAHDAANRSAIELGADDVECAAVVDLKAERCDFWAAHPAEV